MLPSFQHHLRLYIVSLRVNITIPSSMSLRIPTRFVATEVRFGLLWPLLAAFDAMIVVCLFSWFRCTTTLLFLRLTVCPLSLALHLMFRI